MMRFDHARVLVSALSVAAALASSACGSSATSHAGGAGAASPSRTSFDTLETATPTPPEAVHVEAASPASGHSVTARAEDAPPPGFAGARDRGAKAERPKLGLGGQSDLDAELSPMTVTGKVRSFSTDANGRIDGVYLEDGTSARAGAEARIPSLGVKAGDTITVTGRGGTYVQGRSLHIDTLTLPSGEVRTLARPRAELSSVTLDGAVARVLVNPRGEVDGLLLRGGALVRLPPRGALPVAPGASVQAVGEGTARFVHARTLTIRATSSSAEQTVDLAAAMPPATSSAPLAPLDVTATIADVVRGPDGDAEVIVLANGALVTLPPAVRDDAGEGLRVGEKVSVRGEGGVYAKVMSIRATHLELANGQVFDDAPAAAR